MGRLAATESGSVITSVPKGKKPPATCADLRGISVGTLSAKVYATVLERRVSAWAEAAGVRAEGQFGFRRRRGTSHAAFVLRTLQEQAQLLGGELWACFVDFKQAYDRDAAGCWELLGEDPPMGATPGAARGGGGRAGGARRAA